MMACRPKVIFWPYGSTSPGHYGYQIVHWQRRTFLKTKGVH
jgi:hypothetical protein